jgi:CheY-like chemotaxis protein
MRGRQPMPSKPPLVLVVEDNLDAQTITAAILAHRGYAVMKVGSVCEAREIVQRRRPDVVVLDCKLPDGDGLELAKQWRSDPMMRRIPIVVLTAFSARQDVEAALLAGVDAFLVKPVTSVALTTQIAKVLGTRKSDTFRAPSPLPPRQPTKGVAKTNR